jgi:hypothetical protein
VGVVADRLNLAFPSSCDLGRGSRDRQDITLERSDSLNKKAVISLAFVFLFAFSAAAFAKHGGGDDRGDRGGRDGRTATFQVKAGNAEQGGNLKLRARAKHGDRKEAFSASAVVHFASGDVTVTLSRKGKNLDARARVPVAQDEALGSVLVDFSVTYGTAVQSLSDTGRIHADDDDDDADDDGDERVGPSPSPDESPES